MSTMVSKLWGANVLPAVCPAVLLLLLLLLLLLVVVAWLEDCLWVESCGCLDHRQPMLLPLLAILPAAGRLSAVVLGAGELLLLLLPASLLPLLPASLLLLLPGCLNRQMLSEDAAAWLLALLLALVLLLRLRWLLALLGGGCGSSTA